MSFLESGILLDVVTYFMQFCTEAVCVCVMFCDDLDDNKGGKECVVSHTVGALHHICRTPISCEILS